MHDDDLRQFKKTGCTPLPSADQEGRVENNGASIWYATYGAGAPVILLHGGLGHSGNWGNQISALVNSGQRVIVIDSRGHGRSTRDDQPYSYELMASDVLAVMDQLQIEQAATVGWSDGACTAMILAMKAPERVRCVFFFACNMDPGGTKEFLSTDTIERCLSRHKKDYLALSVTPDRFQEFADAVYQMQTTQPRYYAEDLKKVKVPVAIVHSEHDEFIKREHSEYLAATIPDAQFILLKNVSHFAPVQRPDHFNQALLPFVKAFQPQQFEKNKTTTEFALSPAVRTAASLADSASVTNGSTPESSGDTENETPEEQYLKFWKKYMLQRVDEVEAMLNTPWGFVCAAILIEVAARLVNGIGQGKLKRQQYEAFIIEWMPDYGPKAANPFKYKFLLSRPGSHPEDKLLPTQMYCIMRSCMVHNHSLMAGESELRSGADDLSIWMVNKKQAKKLGLKHLQNYSRLEPLPAIKDAALIIGENLLDDLRTAIKNIFKAAKSDTALKARIEAHIRDREPLLNWPE